VVYDYLANPALLKHCRPGVRTQFGGKRAGNHSCTQADINARLVALAEPTRSGLRSTFAPDGVPTAGITLGLKEISGANRVVLLATGKGKSEILGALVRSEPSNDCPASLLTKHGDFLVLADQDAAQALPTTTTP